MQTPTRDIPATGSPPRGTVAIAGLGAVGMTVARGLDAGVAGAQALQLTAVSARDLERARSRVARFRAPPAVVPIGELATHAAIVVECAPSSAFREILEPALAAGRTVLALSVGGLLAHPDLVDVAREHGGRIVVPSGAIAGLDAVQAAALGGLRSVRMITTKPPAGLAGAPYLLENGIDLDGLSEPRCVFRGNAADGARHFPANVNVAAALGLAGIGAQATELEIWADPAIEQNRHRVTVEADAVRIELTIENVPSRENPRTGRIVAPSVLATLRKLVSPLAVGT